LVLSTLIHMDDIHLYYNTASLLWKGSTLEHRWGSERFAAFVAYATMASGALAVCMGLVAEHLALGTLGCAVGFSGVLYAMSAVVLMTDSPDASTHVHGLQVPRKLPVWVDVVLSSVMHAHVSFLGHLAGASAGWMWCLLTSWRAARDTDRGGGHARRRHDYGSGRVGGRRADTTHFVRVD